MKATLLEFAVRFLIERDMMSQLLQKYIINSNFLTFLKSSFATQLSAIVNLMLLLDFTRVPICFQAA
jgi:hypothetical protein